MNKHFKTITEETKDLLTEVTAELQECVPAVVLIQELESCIPTDIKDQIELEYEIKGNEAAVNCLLHHLVSGEHWQLRLAEALLSSNINLPNLAEKLKQSQENLVSKSYNISNEYDCGNNNNNNNIYEALQKEVSRNWSLPEESKWESILPNLLGPLKQLDQEYPDSWRLLALHLGYSFEEVSQLENLGLNTDPGSTLVNLIHNWLAHTRSDIDTLLIALGKMQNAQEVLNNSQISEHMPYSIPFVEGNDMEPLVGDGQKLNSSSGLLHNSKFQNIQHAAGVAQLGRDGAIDALDAKHTSDSNKINTASLDADNNNDLEDHTFSTHAVFFDTDAKNMSYLNNAVRNHSSSSSDTDSKVHEQIPESISVGMYGKSLSQVSGDTLEYESKVQGGDATLDIPAFNPVPRPWSILDDVQADGNLVSPTLTPLLPSSSVIEPMVTPDYSTSPSYSKEPLSSSLSSTKQDTPEMLNFYTNNDSNETLLSSPFFGKDSVPADVSGSMSSLPALQNNGMSPITELSSNTDKPKEAQELNEDDTRNQNNVLLENKLPSSSDILDDSGKHILLDVENVAKNLSEIPSENLKPFVENTETSDNCTDSSLSVGEDNSEQKVYTEYQQITLTDSPQDNISESIIPSMLEVNAEENSDITTDNSYSEISPEINMSNVNELKQSTEISEHSIPEGGFQNNMSDASSSSEVNLAKTESNSLTDRSFEMNTGDNVADFKSHMSGDIDMDRSEKKSPKDDFQNEVSEKTVTTIPEGTQHENALLEISFDRETCASVDQKILAEGVGALDSGFESKCETEVNAVGASETNSKHISDEDLSKSEESGITGKHESHIKKSAFEIVDSAIEAAVQLESESMSSVTSKAEQECLKENKDGTPKIDLKNHFTSQNISYVVIAAALLSTTLILVHKFWK